MAARALLQLAAATRAPLWANHSGWATGSGASSCCGWFGVECTDGSPASINLFSNGLEGTLPDGIFGAATLPQLRFLSVGYNILSGTLPSSLARATRLEYLDARLNWLSGTLPQPLPPALRSLQLHFNLIGGDFHGLGGLGKLEAIDMVHNTLSGTLPDTGWGDPAALRALSIGYNKLSGSVPTGIGNLKPAELRVLDLGPNLLTTVGAAMCPVIQHARAEHMRCGLAKNPLICPIPDCVEAAPLQCGAVCHNATHNATRQPQQAAPEAPRTSRRALGRHSSMRRRRRAPPPPPPPPRPPRPSSAQWRSVSCGGEHTCGLLRNTSGLKCWGSNSSGQLGPAAFAGRRWAQVSASDGDHSCALEVVDGGSRLLCWGLDDHGQAAVPAAAVSTSSWVSTGRYHTCALSTVGAIRCWGRNSESQTTVPPLPANESWVRVRAGGHFTCGTSSAGAVHCWGCRADAPPNPTDPHGCKFGRGQTIVPDGLAGSTLESGAYSSCALTAHAGADNIACWGGVDAPPEGMRWSLVAPGRYAWCGLTEAGTLVCWGMRGMCIEKQPPSPATPGKIGHCDLLQAALPAPVPGSRWVDMASGGWHACVLAKNGELRCFGSNDANQTRVPA